MRRYRLTVEVIDDCKPQPLQRHELQEMLEACAGRTAGVTVKVLEIVLEPSEPMETQA